MGICYMQLQLVTASDYFCWATAFENRYFWNLHIVFLSELFYKTGLQIPLHINIHIIFSFFLKKIGEHVEIFKCKAVVGLCFLKALQLYT